MSEFDKRGEAAGSDKARSRGRAQQPPRKPDLEWPYNLVKKAYWKGVDLEADMENGKTVTWPSEDIFRCSICGAFGVQVQQHHTSYVAPERIALVCGHCHQKIHHKDGFRDDLEPDRTRSWAKEHGFTLSGLTKARLITPGSYKIKDGQRKRYLDAAGSDGEPNGDI